MSRLSKSEFSRNHILCHKKTRQIKTSSNKMLIYISFNYLRILLGTEKLKTKKNYNQNYEDDFPTKCCNECGVI